MRGAIFPLSLQKLFPLLAPLLALAGCSASQPPTRPAPTAPAAPLFRSALPEPRPAGARAPAIMLGIDVLEADGFAAVKGKRIGLLTHPAGVNRRGVSTVDVLRRAPGVQLVALYGPEHGIYGDAPAEVKVPNSIDKRTGLPVYSVYGQFRRPTKEMLKGINALVIDLQDIGTRSYTFTSAMKWAMEACFENGVEVIVLDRPNPLGGLKVDGPPLDAELAVNNYVGAFRVPYVHGLTIGELARMAKDLRPPGGLAISDAARARGKLTVIPMRGWRRSMRWPETGLTWVPTSARIQDFAAVQGYPMVGLGTYFHPAVKFDLGFRHGVGTTYDFRGIAHVSVKSDVLERELRALSIPGLQFRRVSAPDRNGRPGTGVYVEITDYDAWRPTELNFYLMKLACKFDPRNPFALWPGRDFSGFLRHLGSQEFLAAIRRDGARIDVDSWVRRWHEQALAYQQASKKYWLYR
ncbi:DUF1343 domain-containing protein [Opitutus sp. ER46]|uniref:DUF1343 domain-containing protein n=1 Tax=Opitutus sp. ER46 TaxID=2161864 RepID=UPI000D316CA5|nr:DUF1343 domain-containing protein [Opitutus sp. ER46]PTX95478.1 DUF1343 domain-containing protein [Opitutus sp. ER46]